MKKIKAAKKKEFEIVEFFYFLDSHSGQQEEALVDFAKHLANDFQDLTQLSVFPSN